MRVTIYLLLLPLLLNSCNSDGVDFTIKTTLNPHKISPLTALLEIKTDRPCKATIKVLGNDPIEQAYEKLGTELTVPVVGLYPNTLNEVEVTLAYEGGQVIEIVKIQTGLIPNYFPIIKINKVDRTKMEEGLHALDIHFANFGKILSSPILFDDKGVVRWYLDLSFHGAMVSPFQKMKDGNILVVGRHTIYEFDMLGKQLKKNNISTNYGMHHEVLELPNEDLLIAVGKRDAFLNVDGKRIQSDNDFMIHYSRKQNKIMKEWDLAKHLDVTRDDHNFFREGDWLHMNALEFDPSDSTIIVSGRNQGLIKVSWNDELKWILSPKQHWGVSGRDHNGSETKSFLLTAVNKEGKVYGDDIQTGNVSAEDFDFPWGSHAPDLLPNGNIIVFDNGTFRNYNNENNYSRAVEYKVNEENKTFEQVWQFGKERGMNFFSSIVSDVDYLPNSGNILITAGFLSPGANPSAKVVEVSPTDNVEVFEATIKMKDLNTGGKSGWGHSDILYRSERMLLRY
ncbi:MAG: aryl-sulfate sulfotransferase [Cyclobacteriaceae bacterium]|nr:aryl-sulfate sulfotransferase [Cyclobacteriaceae bacterium]